MSARDPLLRAALREREMRAEHRINLLRGVVLGGAALTDVVYAVVKDLLSWRLAALALVVIPFFVLYWAIVHRLSRDRVYRPWLKYVTVTVDYLLVLFVFVEYRAIGFFDRPGPDAGVPEMVGFLILLNVLTAFRHGSAIIAYSTVVGTGIAAALALRDSTSLALQLYAPLSLVASGWLAWLLSTGVHELFLRLRDRERLLRFLPREVVRGIDAGEIRVELGGVKREATILLSDLRDFTHLAEHRDPAEVVRILNEYFTAMATVIWEGGGTIDKFIGDAILAVFGVPLAHDGHALRAVESAFAMQRSLAHLNEKHATSGLPEMRMGIALHTGTIVAGNVGTPERMEYTIVGDAVNLTARIEELNKRYGTRLLLSESTYERIRDRVACRLIDEPHIRGREQPIRVYTPAG